MCRRLLGILIGLNFDFSKQYKCNTNSIITSHVNVTSFLVGGFACLQFDQTLTACWAAVETRTKM